MNSIFINFKRGPEGTPFEDGIFVAHLSFPNDYPLSPPTMRFVSELFHPNIYADGRVCISILHPPGTDPHNPSESAEERWRPILGVDAIILSVISMLSSPNIDSPANLEASLMYRDHIADYNQKVRALAMKSIEEL